MRRRTIAPWLVVVGLTAASLMTGAPASAAPIDKGHFIDAGSEDFSCDTVTPAIPTHHEFEARVNFVFNQRGGTNVFPYYRESVSGREAFTNLDTGGTYSLKFTANNRDHKIVDNGDGTITITSTVSGSQRWSDADGRLVLVSSGQFRFSIGIDYNGTPGDPDDDTEVPDSFQLINSITGRDDLVDRNFCADLRQFTT